MSKWQAGEEAYGSHRQADMKKTKKQAEMIPESQNEKRRFLPVK